MRLDQPKPVDRQPLTLADVGEPAPGPSEVLVRVDVCGVCRTDLHVVEGELPAVRSPVIPGHQIIGTVAARGPDARRFEIGDRVGVAWLHAACGTCAFCTSAAEQENLCENARFTGYSVDGGYAEYAKVPEAFAYRVPDAFTNEEAAPLLCAGIIGYRALRLSGVQPGGRLGLYGFGASAHIAIQVAKHWGCEVYVFTRSEANQRLAKQLGAAWVGSAKETPPAKLNSSIIFAPAGPLILDAMAVLEKGGTVALAGIYMSEVPPMDYVRHLYDEKVLRSVANSTRRDGEELLSVAAEIPVRTETTVFPLDQANEALLALKTGGISGAAVLNCGSRD
jgi:propanol-preferring alcohol dehydrogenase